MDNRLQSNFGIPVASNGTDTRNMYILQVKPNNADGPLEAEAIPLNMLINEQDAENEQYLISVLQAKPLQLFIDPQGQVTTNANGQYYELPIPESQNNTDFINSLQIMNSLSTLTPDQLKTDVGHASEVVPETSLTNITSNGSDQEKLKTRAVKKSNTCQKSVIQRFVHIKDRVVPPRAVAGLPPALQLRRGVVSPRRALPARVRFGPVEGISKTVSPAEVESLVAEAISSNLPVFLLKVDGQTVHIDVSDKDKANWVSLLPLDGARANVWLQQEGGALWALAQRPLPPRAPLALGYGPGYAAAHRLPPPPPLGLHEELAAAARQWRCGECPRALPSAALLQRHVDTHHAEEKQRARQRYRCRHCTRTFSRMFTLRRHIARHCTKKVKEQTIEKPPEPVAEILDSSRPDLPELTLNAAHADDSRLPSDESLQASLLASNLDFPALFDTDRMPNLDISGSSKSDDFNPYALGLKDDIGLENGCIDFEIETACNGSKEMKAESEEPLLLTCRYCDQAVVRGRQRQHVRSCEGRKFQCECGRTFLYKEKLALHIQFDHADAPAAGGPLDDKKKSEDPQYKCETCKHTFKRRGMLVNHLWRVHRAAAQAVPLERRVRHYPCGACPKLYRTAAKRQRHARLHHPGAMPPGSSAPPAIEGGRSACAPAACAACPRQYATRAKLLQHVRAQHPLLAPPVQRRTTKRK